MLQSGDPETLRLWKLLVDLSMQYFDRLYRKLGVLLTNDDLAGESMYNDLLPEVVERLRTAGLLEESDGAEVVFPPGYTNREGEPLPLIVRSAVGGFNYGTSDLACVLDRVERVKATLLLYVVGARRSRNTSRWCSMSPRWPAGCDRRPERCTSRSASCWAPTARC